MPLKAFHVLRLKVSSGMVPSSVNSAVSPSPLQGMDGTPAVWARMPAAILGPKAFQTIPSY